MIPRRRLIASLIVVSVAAAACDQLPLLAPTNSTIALFAASTVVETNGSTEITANVLESSGTPVHNGTLVSFTTTVGQLNPREARTHNGSVTVTFFGAGQSGEAEIRANSGNAKMTPEVLRIKVGAAAAETVNLVPSPGTVPPTGGTVTLIATVRGAGGQGLPGILVTFSASAGNLSATSAITDANGEARVALTTFQESRVRARAGTKESPEVTVAVRATTGVSVSANPSSAVANSTVVFTITPSANTIVRNARIDFGDGSSTPLGTVTAATTIPHLYTNHGTFPVTVTGVDSAGDSVSGSTSVVILQRAPLDVSITASEPRRVAVSIQFTAVVVESGTNTAVPVTSTVWDFGDGVAPKFVNSRTTSYIYGGNGGAREVRVTVNTADGRTATGLLQIFVLP